MTLKSSRSLAEMRPVLLDPKASGPDPVYQVYTDLNNSWVNQTIIHPGLYGKEYAKTFGHHHTISHPENYAVSEGEGILILESDKEIKLVKAKPGSRVNIAPEYSHAWVNTGSSNLVLLDDWNSPHFPTDYEPVAQKHGLGYYIINENGQPKAVPNPNYSNLPEPQWIEG